MNISRILRIVPLAATLAALPLCSDAALHLARGGATRYVVVMPTNACAVDRYAATTLTNVLHRITGAQFPVAAAPGSPDQPTLFVGLGKPAIEHLDKANPLSELEDQEHVARSKGQDIFLYGRGIHGALRAVMLFLTEQCGWRWFSMFENAVLPEQPTLTLQPFELKRGFSYLYRSAPLSYSWDFHYQNGINMRFDKKMRRHHARNKKPLPPRCERPYVSARPEMFGYTHSLHRYIPPEPGQRHAFPWLETQGYFAAHPEYFSLWDNGRRMKNKQLCFSNPEVRAEFTRNVLSQIEREEEGLIVEVAAMDATGAFCFCDGCEALKERYQAVGGPIVDYLIELGGLLQARHPEVRIKTFAYRRSQTQKAPVLPDGGRLPSNIIVEFAPIEDNYFADWSHPDPFIRETYADLRDWAALTAEGNLWSWIYPNPWGSGARMPVGNVERLINMMRQMYDAGVRGFWLDHGHFHHMRSGWGELQAYLIYRLAQDITADTDTIIEEFTDHMYGPAAPLMRRYLNELEAGRKAITDLSAHGQVSTPGQGVSYKSVPYADHIFPYLTVANIHLWQCLFDEMVQLTKDDPRLRNNVRYARRELDFATLWKWSALQAAHPAAYTDHHAVADRIRSINNAAPVPLPDRKPQPMGGVQPFIDIIETAGPMPPLPTPLEDVDTEHAVQLPARSAFLYSRWGFRAELVRDPAAAGGLAVRLKVGGQPFTAGYYNEITRERTSIELAPDNVNTDQYALYRFGRTTLGREGYFWFDRSWKITFAEIRELYDPKKPDAEWELWASVRFTGPSYQHDTDPDADDRVFVDRIICIPIKKQDGSQREGTEAETSDQPDFDFAVPNE